jgi:hypothetical protein
LMRLTAMRDPIAPRPKNATFAIFGAPSNKASPFCPPLLRRHRRPLAGELEHEGT